MNPGSFGNIFFSFPSFRRILFRNISTVFALSSGSGKSGIAIVRISGSDAKQAIIKMTRPLTLPEPRKAFLRHIVHPFSGETLDRGLVLWFPKPNSFTGEDCCEFHVHGGTAVVAAVMEALGSMVQFTYAQPGEFTKRAFYNGKLDLTEVEGLADLIDAETEAQRRQALRQMEGSLSMLYTSWRDTLVTCRAYLEAYIDFSEDDNIEEGVITKVKTSLTNLMNEMQCHLSDDRRGERLRSGLHLVILGAPNVGKSSLLNLLVNRPVAIVSSVAGTTRDIVQTNLDIGGFPVVVSDTAGLHTTSDEIEAEGVRRAVAAARSADLAVVMMDAMEWRCRYADDVHTFQEHLSHLLPTTLHDWDVNSFEWFKSGKYLVVVNKVDLLVEGELTDHIGQSLGENVVLLSAKTGEGFTTFVDKLKFVCARLCSSDSTSNPTLTNSRHRTHINTCLKTLEKVFHGDSDFVESELTAELHNSDVIVKPSDPTLNMYQNSNPMSEDNKYVHESRGLLESEETLVIAAHHLERASYHLGCITGQVTNEDILDHIFSTFCIGK